MQLDLIEAIEAYPRSPGFKERGGASQDAAEAIKPKAAALRDKALYLLSLHPDGLTVGDFEDRNFKRSAMAPRLSQLLEEGKIEKAGRRKHPSSRFTLTVYRVREGE